MPTNASSLEAPRNRNPWVIQVFGTVLFFIAGFAKLVGDEQMVQMFCCHRHWPVFSLCDGFIEGASAKIECIDKIE
jgi:hypothetical protein